jgi:hypothetical protein
VRSWLPTIFGNASRNAEVAAALACNRRTAGRLIERGLDHVRLLLTRCGVTCSAVAALVLLPSDTAAGDAVVLTRCARPAALPLATAASVSLLTAAVAGLLLGAVAAVVLMRPPTVAPVPVAVPGAPDPAVVTLPTPRRQVLIDEDFTRLDRWQVWQSVSLSKPQQMPDDMFRTVPTAAPLAHLVDDAELPGRVLELDPTTADTGELRLNARRELRARDLMGDAPCQVRLRLRYLPLGDGVVPATVPAGWHDEVWQVEPMHLLPPFLGLGDAPREAAPAGTRFHVVQRFRRHADGRVEVLPSERAEDNWASCQMTVVIARALRVRIARVVVTAD